MRGLYIKNGERRLTKVKMSVDQVSYLEVDLGKIRIFR